MSEVPDKVIEAAFLKVSPFRYGCPPSQLLDRREREAEFRRELLEVAPVIAAWARSQERDQIRKVISEFQDRAYTPDGDYIDVPYWEGAFDLVGHLEDRLPPLDREEDQ